MNEYIRLDHVQPLTREEYGYSSPWHYIPHLPVFKESQLTNLDRDEMIPAESHNTSIQFREQLPHLMDFT